MLAHEDWDKLPPRLTLRVSGSPTDAITLFADGRFVSAGLPENIFKCISGFDLKPGSLWRMEVVSRNKAYTIRVRTPAERAAGVKAVIDEQPLNEDINS
jgi:hypothetical protein